MKSRALGRGLDVLLGDDTRSMDAQDAVMDIPILDIDPNPKQPRRSFDDEKLQQLAESIRSVGILQPIMVYQKGERYTLITGERRWRAARMIGLKSVPCLVRDFDDVQRMEASLIENIQRDDLNPVEEAQAIQSLMEECGILQQEVAERIGKSRSAVANLLRILALPPAILQKVAEGWLTEGHARALVNIKEPELCIEIANLVIEKGLSVRRTEALVEEILQDKKKPEKEKVETGTGSGSELSVVEERLRNVLGTKVSLQGTDKRGRITIQYYSRDQLESIYEYFGRE